MELGKLIDTQMMGILSAVSENPNIKNTDIKGLLSNRAVLTKKIQELAKAELIEETRHGRYNLKTYSISPRGAEVLAIMESLKTVMAEDERQKSENGEDAGRGITRSC